MAHILVVEDKPALQAMVVRLLEGHEVDAVVLGSAITPGRQLELEIRIRLESQRPTHVDERDEAHERPDQREHDGTRKEAGSKCEQSVEHEGRLGRRSVCGVR